MLNIFREILFHNTEIHKEYDILLCIYSYAHFRIDNVRLSIHCLAYNGYTQITKKMLILPSFFNL